MKKNLLVFACASLFMFGTAFAQSKTSQSGESSSKPATQTTTMSKSSTPSSTHTDRTPEERAKEATDKMTSELNLTADQQQKALQTNLKYYKALEAMQAKKTEDSSKESAEDHRDYLNKERKDEFRTYLSEEQMTKLEKKLSKEKEDKTERKSKSAEKSME